MEENNLNNNIQNKQSNGMMAGIVIGLLIALVVGMGAYIVFDKVIDAKKNNDEKESVPVATPVPTATPTPSATPASTPEPVEEKVTCSDCKTSFKFPGEFSKRKLIKEKILLGNDVKEIEINPTDDSVKVNGNVIFTTTVAHETSIDAVYIISNEVIMVVESGSYVNNGKLFFFDKDGNKLNVDTVLDEKYKEYPDKMDIASYDGDGQSGEMVDVQGNKIIITGIRFNKFDPGNEGLCSNGIINSQYKGELYKAKYEIDYLGNNQFSKAKQIQVLQNVDDSICK